MEKTRKQETRPLWGYMTHMKSHLKFFVDGTLSLFDKNVDSKISIICHRKDDAQYAGIISDSYNEEDFFQLINGLKEPMSKISMVNHYVTEDEVANKKIQESIPNVGYRNAINEYCEKYNFAQDRTFNVFGPLTAYRVFLSVLYN